MARLIAVRRAISANTKRQSAAIPSFTIQVSVAEAHIAAPDGVFAKDNQEYDRAVDAIDDHLHQDPDDRYARLLRSQVGLVSDRNELVETDPCNLPSVEEVCGAYAGLGVAQVLAHGPDPLAAAAYAYELYRRFPKEVDAHSALAQVVFAPTHSEPQLGSPEVAGPGVAVFYREQEGPPQHVIIEDGPDPSFDRNEISPDDERAVALAGCRVGETFIWNERGLQKREGKIVALMNKISFRARDCMDNWVDRFPGRPAFERIRALEGAASDEEPLVQLRPFLDSLRKIQKREDELIQIYNEQPMALPMLSKSLGRSVLETAGILATTRGQTIKCCGGTATEFEAAVAAMRMTDEIVLDGTACATLFLLEVDEWVADLPFRCVVCEATLQEYRNLARGAATGREAGRVGFIDDQLFVSEMDEEQPRKWAERLTNFVGRIEQSCEVVSGGDLAKFDVNTRHLIQEAFRGGTAEAIAVAKARSVPIWTDDLGIGQLCTIEYGIRRTWTQAVLLAAEDARLIATEAASESTIKLYRWGYQFTGLGGRSVRRACEIAQWDPNREPAATVLNVFSNRTFGREYVLKVLYSSVLAIWQSVAITELAEQLTIRILENLDRDPDGRMLAGTLLSNIEKLFGLDVVHARRAERCIYAWLSTVPTRVLVP